MERQPLESSSRKRKRWSSWGILSFAARSASRERIFKQSRGFQVENECLGEPETSPAVIKGMRAANPWLDLRAKLSTDLRPKLCSDMNLPQISDKPLRFDSPAEVRRAGPIRL